MAKQTNWWNELDCNAKTSGYLKSEVENGSAGGMGLASYETEPEQAICGKGSVPDENTLANSANSSLPREHDMVLGQSAPILGEEESAHFRVGPSDPVGQLHMNALGYAVMRGHEVNGAAGHLMGMASRGGFVELATEPERGEDLDGEGKEKDERDHAGKKKRAELWQDAEMDALVRAYRHIHLKLMSAGNKGRHIYKTANEKWTEVRNLLLTVGVDRQPKEIERKWSNLLTAFKQIVDWNKQPGQQSYWELDEAFKKEKTKAKELPASFRMQMFESMAEFLGDTGCKKNRQSSHSSAQANLSLMGTSNNSDSCGSAATSGSMDIPLPLEKISCQANRTCSTDSLETKQMQVILVAAGSFNPPTYMHLRMFELARDALLSDGYAVLGGYMSPVNDAYGKKDLASAEHRIKLCELACEDSSYIMVDPWEAKQSSYQRTLTVLNRVEFSLRTSGLVNADSLKVMLLCGADLLESFTMPGVWVPDMVKAICRDHGVVCISRDGKNVEKLIFENDILFENKRNIVVVDEVVSNNISSTKVRQILARGLSVKYLTPNPVIDYIKKHKLYVNHTK
ncbi:uncharacterized protein LOC131034873 isoform X1 [Cryptomeria japonica]|uniref:uncharacterized protein LOC131034873 isoform X1 n=1 Tax=Cryptomeria japonica TaxID=3369 RepID=UPI0027DAB2AA|nr:uncharacterized protein LOC131034873 isoform X1 [Cryptomeria japonica]XP_057822454.2 uncharacterized protein LOC131034873 isoform X1 [Cryptomeria japonica]